MHAWAVLQVLRVLLQHCKRHGMLWTKGELYGDGWTPLMSATVAGHASLVKLLLTLAGDRVRELAAAQNKYGSTALHLAAYRGSVPMIKLLLRHHIQSLLTWRDARGFTPAQIARKHSHFAAEALLARKSAAVMAY
jgi:ankyrin repeat protein